ncbi:hypothetical protein [Gimesia aquarii]|uniref:Carboxypeptidase regulatory-like domain-containing protein n=1 Tax=Gimesia aquarii TaxID=2527964 RepID=A0A517VWA4_9PLAN|nr:hypothetical protein [Gimesia aquarii]QDT97285.1 hypothetical protein V144x_27570 [Gimesia aquarii]
MRILLLVVMFLGTTGCGKSIEQASSSASGKITLDGKPLTSGTLNFYPANEGNSAFATINSDGTFTVNTSAGTNGLEPGDYSVVVSYEVPSMIDDEGAEVPGVNPIPARFRNEEAPEISITVPKSGTDALNIDLTSQ